MLELVGTVNDRYTPGSIQRQLQAVRILSSEQWKDSGKTMPRIPEQECGEGRVSMVLGMHTGRNSEHIVVLMASLVPLGNMVPCNVASIEITT